ncbi:MAG: hypothetical protein IJX09_05190 [Clostridia bacterium]|nr:hypothetical protein [Clostridia bacterium]
MAGVLRRSLKNGKMVQDVSSFFCPSMDGKRCKTQAVFSTRQWTEKRCKT